MASTDKRVLPYRPGKAAGMAATASVLKPDPKRVAGGLAAAQTAELVRAFGSGMAGLGAPAPGGATGGAGAPAPGGGTAGMNTNQGGGYRRHRRSAHRKSHRKSHKSRKGSRKAHRKSRRHSRR